MRNKFLFISVLLALTVFVSACASPVASGSSAAPVPQPAPRTLITSGTGQVTIKPDIAYINIGVHTEGASATEAVTQNTKDSQAVMDALKGAGVAADDLQTNNYSIYQNNQTGPDGKVVGTNYVVDNTIYVTVRDLSKLGGLLDAAVRAGANNVNSIQFDLADKTKAMSDARAAAVKAAKTEAAELAAAAGVTLGDVQTINYTENTPGPVFYGKGGGMAATSAAVPISSGTLQISVDVTLTYEIK